MSPLRCDRAEIWTDLECAGGTILATVADVLNLPVTRSIVAERSITMNLPLASAAYPSLLEGRVIALRYVDGSSEEWRINKITSADGGAGGSGGSGDGGIVSVTAVHPLGDLQELPFLSQLSSAGSPNYTLGGVDTSPADYITDLILADANVITNAPWLSLGTIDPTALLTLSWDHLTPYGALQSIVSALTTARLPCELDLRKVGSTGYAIDLLSAIGESAPTPVLAVGTHLSALQRDSDDTDRVTAMTALGASNATMRRAAWLCTVVDSTHIDLSDPNGIVSPILVDHQLSPKVVNPALSNCALVRPDTGALVEITASVASTGRCTVASTTGFTTGDLVEVRANPSGMMLDTLTIPGSRVKFGSKSDAAFAGDYNVVPNPYQDVWTSPTSAADGWTLTSNYGTPTGGNAAPTFTRVTSPAPTYGVFGAHIVATTLAFNITGAALYGGSGVTGYKTPLTPFITTTTDDPQLSAKVRVYINSLGTYFNGVQVRVRVQLERMGAGATDVDRYLFPVAILDTSADVATGTWVDLEINGVTIPASDRYYLRIFEKDAGAATAGFDVVIGEAQITQTPSNVAWVNGSAANKLWTLANYGLSANGATLVQYTAQQIDHARRDPMGFAHAVVELGATCRVQDPALGINTTLRCVGITQDLYDPTQPTTLMFAVQQSTLTQVLAASLVAVSQIESQTGGTSGVSSGGVTVTSSTLAQLQAASNFTQVGSSAVTYPVQQKIAERFTPRDFGAQGNQTHDDTTAFANCIAAAIASNQRSIYVNAGWYYLTSLPAIPAGFTFIGEGFARTVLEFAPGANATCVTLSDAAGVLSSWGEFGGFTFYTQDVTHLLVALRCVDLSNWKIRDLLIRGIGTASTVAGSLAFGGAGSIGIQYEGREYCHFSHLEICADRPIVSSANPNTARTDGEDMDHVEWHDLYLLPGDTHYAIEADAGLGWSHVKMTGNQASVGGAGYLKMRDTRVSPIVASRAIVLNHLRGEQGQGGTSYWIDVQFTAPCLTFLTHDCMGDSNLQGFKFDGVTNLSMTHAISAARSGKDSFKVINPPTGAVVNVDGCYWQPASVVTLTGYTLLWSGLFDSAVTAGPSCARYAIAMVGSRLLAEKVTARNAATTIALSVQESGTGDGMQVLPQPAGSGVAIRAMNQAESDFTPMTQVGSTFTWKYRTGVATTADAAAIDTAGHFIAKVGLGVGNSASATTPGSIVKKIQVFDAAGASLGFIPVYNTIT